jgi:DNA-binding response OmpR family regulator
MHVSRIRAKLNLTPANGYRIVAISGFGYRMEQFGAEELP